MIRALAAILTLAGILSASEAQAQHLFRRGHARQAVSHATPAYTPSYRTVTSTSPMSVSSYSTRSSLTASSGIEEFPFSGTPYRYAYEPYSWNRMAGSNASALARYYDPPVK